MDTGPHVISCALSFPSSGLDKPAIGNDQNTYKEEDVADEETTTRTDETSETEKRPDGSEREESTTVEREVTETPATTPATGDRESLVPPASER